MERSVLLNRNMKVIGTSYAHIQVDNRSYKTKTKYWKVLYFNLDPVGAKSPNVPFKDTFIKAKALAGHEGSFTCQGQGFPVPKFR